MSKCDDLKKEIKEIINDGSKLLDAINFNEKGETADISYFICNYEIWYSKALPVIKQLLPDRLNDFTLLYKNEKRKELSVSTYTISDALRNISHTYNKYTPSTARFCFLR